MSSPRTQKMFQAMPDQIKRLLGASFDINAVIRWSGRVSAGAYLGRDAVLIDITSGTWASGNGRVILIAEPAADLSNTAGFKTQSHASGYTLDGSVRFDMFVETPGAVTDAQSRFERIVLHHLVGQLGAPCQLWFCADGTEPTVQGVNGAGATAAFTSAGWSQPWGMSYPGGV